MENVTLKAIKESLMEYPEGYILNDSVYVTKKEIKYI